METRQHSRGFAEVPNTWDMAHDAASRAQPHYAHIDGLRAIAVLSVVYFHIVVGEATSHWRALPGIQNVGARGVDLFFVLSGFCLAFPYLKRAYEIGRLEIDYGKFISRRFARIAPPYYVALLIFTVLALTPFGYPSTWAASVAALDGSGPREFWLDLLFMTSRQPVANGSFWTLGIEMRWYLVCPLLVALFVRSRIAFAGVFLACYAAYFLPAKHVLDFGTMPAFMLGIVAADLTASRRRFGLPTIAAAAALLALAVWQQSLSPDVDQANPLWHLAFFALVVASNAKIFARMLSWKPLVFFGTTSYSIYLVHQPLIVWLGRHGWSWPLAGGVATLSGIAFWAFVEKPFLVSATREAIARAVARLFARYRQQPIVVPVRYEAEALRSEAREESASVLASLSL